MGTDIHGWVEYKAGFFWHAVISVLPMVPRNYDMFGSLFGVRNHSGFRPIAYRRGVPEDVSRTVRQDLAEDDGDLVEDGGDWFHDPTWLTYSEIKMIDWDETIISRRAFSIEPEGAKLQTVAQVPDDVELVEGNTFEENGKVFRIMKISRRQILNEEWKLIFKWMGDLAEIYGDDNVRLVVYFD